MNVPLMRARRELALHELWLSICQGVQRKSSAVLRVGVKDVSMILLLPQCSDGMLTMQGDRFGQCGGCCFCRSSEPYICCYYLKESSQLRQFACTHISSPSLFRKKNKLPGYTSSYPSSYKQKLWLLPPSRNIATYIA